MLDTQHKDKTENFGGGAGGRGVLINPPRTNQSEWYLQSLTYEKLIGKGLKEYWKGGMGDIPA